MLALTPAHSPGRGRSTHRFRDFMPFGVAMLHGDLRPLLRGKGFLDGLLVDR